MGADLEGGGGGGGGEVFNEGVDPPRACRLFSGVGHRSSTSTVSHEGQNPHRGCCLINTDMDEALCLSHSDFSLQTLTFISQLWERN